MTKDEISDIMGKSIYELNIEIVVEDICSGEGSITELFDLIVNGTDKNVKLHSAWVLEKIAKRDMELCMPLFFDILELLPTLTYNTHKRCFSKIIFIYLENYFKKKKKVTDYDYVQNYNWDGIIETLFDNLLNSKTANAIKVLSAYCLAYLSIRYRWIEDELKFQMSLQLYCPSLIAANKKINYIYSKHYKLNI